MLVEEQAAGQDCQVQQSSGPGGSKSWARRDSGGATASAFRFRCCCVQLEKISLRAACQLWPLGKCSIGVAMRTEARLKWAEEGEEWHK